MRPTNLPTQTPTDKVLEESGLSTINVIVLAVLLPIFLAVISAVFCYQLGKVRARNRDILRFRTPALAFEETAILYPSAEAMISLPGIEKEKESVEIGLDMIKILDIEDDLIFDLQLRQFIYFQQHPFEENWLHREDFKNTSNNALNMLAPDDSSNSNIGNIDSDLSESLFIEATLISDPPSPVHRLSNV